MCGRVRLSSDYSEIVNIRLRLDDLAPGLNFGPNWNGAPTQMLPIAARSRQRAPNSGAGAVGPAAVPGQGRELSCSTFNAQSETVDTKPAFRESFFEAGPALPCPGRQFL